MLGEVLMLTHSQFKTLILAAVVMVTSPAFAKKSRREGFNFGSGVKILSSDDRTLAGDTSDKNVHSIKSTEAFSPYVAISGGTFNIGLMGSVDKTVVSEIETSATSDDENIRNREIKTSSGSVFMRFLFGEILFLEGGMGIYQEKQHIKNTTTNANGNGNFLGAKEEYKIDGSGPGYHVGAGFEIATGAGFFFNGTYMTKIYRINEGEAIFGKGNQRAYDQKREVTFGLAYYSN
jgi:hypothetical protein